MRAKVVLTISGEIELPRVWGQDAIEVATFIYNENRSTEDTVFEIVHMLKEIDPVMHDAEVEAVFEPVSK